MCLTEYVATKYEGNQCPLVSISTRKILVYKLNVLSVVCELVWLLDSYRSINSGRSRGIPDRVRRSCQSLIFVNNMKLY